jgi:predicted nucleotidyltransferase
LIEIDYNFTNEYRKRSEVKSLTKEDILNYLHEHKTELSEKFGVDKIGLFGSFARDEQSSDSDIDLAIELKRDRKNLRTFFGLKRELERVFGRKVDMGIESSLKPFVKKSIQDEMIYV